MNRLPRPLLTFLLLAVVLGVIWSMWRATRLPDRVAAEPPASRGGTLVATLRSEPRSFNRLMFRDTPAWLFASLTQGELVRVNRATQEVEPWLAESWETSSDGRTYTFRLRQDVRWSDGVPFTSADVLFSVEAVFDPEVQSLLASSLLIGGQPFTAAAPDPHTVVITYPAPFGPGVRLLGNLTLVPRHKLEGALRDGTFAQAWGASTPLSEVVAIGPFALSRYEAGQRLTFDRNPNFWRRDKAGQPLPYLDRIVLDIVPDQNAELVRLRAGEVDMLQQALRSEDIAVMRSLANEGRIQLVELGVSVDPDSFFFNLRPERWKNDPRRDWIFHDDFRRAISHAVDREAFADTVFLSAAVPIHGPVTSGNREWFWPDLPRYPFSRERSLELLKSIGLENRDGDEWLEDARGTEARFNVLTYRGNTTLERSAAVLRDDLRQVGIAVDVVAIEQGALFERMTKGNFESIFFQFSNTDLDPAMQMDLWLSSGSAHVWNIGQPRPATEWERQIDDLMARQVSTTDFEERRRLFNEVQQIFAEHLPILNFAAPRLFMGVSKRVGNLSPAPTRPQLLWSADTITVQSPMR